MQTSQEHFTTIVYAKFGGQTEWIVCNWKIENRPFAGSGDMVRNKLYWDANNLDCSQSPIFPCDRRCGSWSLNASETGESTKCPWVEVVEGTAGGKNRETVTASLCLVFKGRGRILAPPLIKSINNLFPGEKSLSNQGNMISITCCSTVSRHFD